MRRRRKSCGTPFLLGLQRKCGHGHGEQVELVQAVAGVEAFRSEAANAAGALVVLVAQRDGEPVGLTLAYAGAVFNVVNKSAALLLDA